MFSRTAFVLVVCVIVSCAANYKAVVLESNFYREESCSQKQGYCVLQKECPKQIASEVNLCPYQQSQGAICCGGLRQEDLNCNQLHNVCRTTCPENLNLGKKGCPNGSVCCVLV